MKEKKREVIPLHRMDSETPSGIKFGHAEIENEYGGSMSKPDKNMVHRDDYYLFLFVEKAEAILSIDFEEMPVTGNSVLYIRPGQVHFGISIRKVKTWTLAIDPMLVDKQYMSTFEGQFHIQKPVVLEKSVSETLMKTAGLLETFREYDPVTFDSTIILNLANVFIGIIGRQYAVLQENLIPWQSRSLSIANRFKELLSLNFKTLRSPIQYAQLLNYSLSHLNESVKNITGFPVSYWIHQQIILEAKRLLYYTDMDVKEIAFSLGYDDHAYFSRLFTKIVGTSPGSFRRKFHE